MSGLLIQRRSQVGKVGVRGAFLADLRCLLLQINWQANGDGQQSVSQDSAVHCLACTSDALLVALFWLLGLSRSLYPFSFGDTHRGRHSALEACGKLVEEMKK